MSTLKLSFARKCFHREDVKIDIFNLFYGVITGGTMDLSIFGFCYVCPSMCLKTFTEGKVTYRSVANLHLVLPCLVIVQETCTLQCSQIIKLYFVQVYCRQICTTGSEMVKIDFPFPSSYF